MNPRADTPKLPFCPKNPTEAAVIYKLGPCRRGREGAPTKSMNYFVFASGRVRSATLALDSRQAVLDGVLYGRQFADLLDPAPHHVYGDE